MKVISIITAIITSLLLFSTLMCGLWIKVGKATDVSSMNFHSNIGIASVAFGILSVVLLFVLALKQ
ncbi:MAG TPA: hypothetical protein PK629_10825 [Oscillospiraceae bacterium]|nr:hypothetical protein [Oscillospiraceae bacterium]HPF56822.1 hypothetical protein [Clostridiales bacterium]HPK35780.1 hypothetical protein [Oscillospiraceae bacterium]HPR75400.1 hypothetical protein [Oscillospiraceae bacterium]